MDPENGHKPTRFKKSVRQEENNKRFGILLLFATTCIMLYCRNFIKDPNDTNNQWDQILINFFTLIPGLMYLSICAFLMGSGLPHFRTERGNPKMVVICLMFVFLSGFLFAYLRSVNPGIQNLTIIRQTLLVMDAIALFIFFLATFVNPTVNKQIRGAYVPPDFGRIEGATGDRQLAALLLAHPDVQTQLHPCDINTEEKKAGATKSVKKVKHRNYASMADTEVPIENIVIHV